jgi:hypothetical protein
VRKKSVDRTGFAWYNKRKGGNMKNIKVKGQRVSKKIHALVKEYISDNISDEQYDKSIDKEFYADNDYHKTNISSELRNIFRPVKRSIYDLN